MKVEIMIRNGDFITMNNTSIVNVCRSQNTLLVFQKGAFNYPFTWELDHIFLVAVDGNKVYEHENQI